MLSDIETGYEGKFDFPPRSVPPAVAYLFASTPRSGSTFLSHLLWRTGCFGAPLEYLNYEAAGPYFFAARSPSLQLQLWEGVLRRRTSPNGVFGLKAFPTQLQAMQEQNPELLSSVMRLVLGSGRRRVVHLGRRDRAAHAVSYARASLSGVWRKEQESEAASVDYSRIAVDRAGHMLDAQESAWDQMFAELGIEPLRLWYEDCVAQPERAIDQVADYLGVVIEPEAGVAIPAVERQARADSKLWLNRYRAGE